MMLRRIPAPVVTASLLVLLTMMVLFWGRRGSGVPGASLRTATLSNVRADLADAGCIFTADVRLRSPLQQWTFARIRVEVRKEFVTLLRNKRRYMVANAVERQALGAQMAQAVNRVARHEIADEVDFPRFELF